MAVENNTNQTRQKPVLNQISRSDILGMDCKKAPEQNE